MIDQTERIPLAQAINSVGRAIYGAAWIVRLTEREYWLLERYVDAKAFEATRRMLPGKAPLSDLLRFHRWGEDDPPTALQAEVERAKDRRDWQRSQRRKAEDWLQHRFNCFTRRDPSIKGKHLDRASFERAFAADFSTQQGSMQTETVSSATGSPSGIRTNHDVDAEAACGEWLRERVRQWKGGDAHRMTKSATFEAAKHDVKKGKLSQNAFHRVWAGNAPTEWKKAGAPKGKRHKNRHP